MRDFGKLFKNKDPELSNEEINNCLHDLELDLDLRVAFLTRIIDDFFNQKNIKDFESLKLLDKYCIEIDKTDRYTENQKHYKKRILKDIYFDTLNKWKKLKKNVLKTKTRSYADRTI